MMWAANTVGICDYTMSGLTLSKKLPELLSVTLTRSKFIRANS